MFLPFVLFPASLRPSDSNGARPVEDECPTKLA